MTCLSNIYSVGSFALNTVGDLAQYQRILISMGLHCDPLYSLLDLSVQTKSLSATEL